jgi:hypothetical protein
MKLSAKHFGCCVVFFSINSNGVYTKKKVAQLQINFEIILTLML